MEGVEKFERMREADAVFCQQQSWIREIAAAEVCWCCQLLFLIVVGRCRLFCH